MYNGALGLLVSEHDTKVGSADYLTTIKLRKMPRILKYAYVKSPGEAFLKALGLDLSQPMTDKRKKK